MHDLKDAIRPAGFIPETKAIDKLFQQMQQDKSHMVIVLDEYGQTSGIVTMEDIVEEIVGNIQDEYDEEEELIIKQADGTYIVDGMTPVSYTHLLYDKGSGNDHNSSGGTCTEQ